MTQQYLSNPVKHVYINIRHFVHKACICEERSGIKPPFSRCPQWPIQILSPTPTQKSIK